MQISGLAQRQPAQQFVDALRHLRCRFVGERHGQNRVGLNASILNQISDAIGNNTRLAAARPGQNQQRPVNGFDRFALLGVEFFEERQFFSP